IVGPGEPRPVSVYVAKVAMARSQRAYYLARTIVVALIDDEHIEAGISVRQHAGNRIADEVRPIPRADNYRHMHRVRLPFAWRALLVHLVEHGECSHDCAEEYRNP